MTLSLRSQSRCFNGSMNYYTHDSSACNAPMNFALYLPPQAQTQSVPVLYYLSGLTCSEENFSIKAGAQRFAAELGIMLVIPDTSPRRTGIVGEDDSIDLGSGAGFYVDATQDPWKAHYQMYTYITRELPQLIWTHFPGRADKQGIFGHSMGGHGALVCGLTNPDKYLSLSAFAPIAAPIGTELGDKAFSAYLGENRSAWKAYDATELVRRYQFRDTILIDQGTADEYYEKQLLLPEKFVSACKESGQSVNFRLHRGYDHGYFMISTFIEDHLRHHARILCQ
ncbi:MAG: S-formylglutathione hydrolase [Chroococcopsis gigantea SAG 12.99]|jgi:S-formylglutathione hydrolase|nr:S-formylglutathione hydrolase [Chlorogloea purpurea SAG 13.99]MDV2999747.1 S-formylglutathione hydrolase [Chroococcopsis gigantea SAG 12.99]